VGDRAWDILREFLSHNFCPDSYINVLSGNPECDTGKAKMQKTVTRSLTRSMNSETDGHAGVITVALRYGSQS